jgi:hypothetical protein
MLCEICQQREGVHRHHVFFGTANRRKSEQWGMVARLCPDCHEFADWSVHRCRKTDLELKMKYQKIFEDKYSHELFMQEFGRNYL